MTKKIFTIIAVLSVIAMSAIGCQSVTDDNNTESSNDKTDNDILAAPVVELPANVGVNPFKGKTFKSGEYHKYVFSSDGKTVTIEDNYDNEGFVPSTQFEYSIDANKGELSWHMEKGRFFSFCKQPYSFEELAAYIKSEKFLENCEAELKEDLDKGYITADEFDERLKEIKDAVSDENIADFISSFKEDFTAITRFKYTYDSAKGTLDLVEQFEKSSSRLDYRGNPSNGLYLSSALVESQFMRADFCKDNDIIVFYSQSFSDNEIVLVNEDDESDTFTAKYKLTGSGNDTKMQLSFTYGGKEFNPTLDFAPSERHLTEVK